MKVRIENLEMRNEQTLVPELRFPEFETDENWKEIPLNSVATRIRKKVGTKKLTPVSITAGVGFVDQAAKFGRSIAGEQYKNYIHIKRGDFVYNKGNSKTFAQGCIYQLKEFDEAAASTAFICFELDSSCVDHYFQSLFECNTHGRQLAKFITSGARSDGLLNINPDDFFSIELPVPPTQAEQQKIADCLGSLDELIAAHSRKLTALQDHKKGLLQQLFPAEGETTPKLRFPEFEHAGEWKKSTLQGVCNMRAGTFIKASEISEVPQINCFPCYGGNGLRGYTTTSTHSGTFPLIGRQGAHCGNVKLGRGSFHATEHALVTTPLNGNSSEWLFYALTRLNLNQYATGQAQPGLSVDVLNRVLINYPDFNEQQKIDDCLSELDALINAQTKQIAALKDHKKGLMQQLFPTG